MFVRDEERPRPDCAHFAMACFFDAGEPDERRESLGARALGPDQRNKKKKSLFEPIQSASKHSEDFGYLRKEKRASGEWQRARKH